MSSRGMVTVPPSDSRVSNWSACSRLSASTDSEKLLPTASGGPPGALSLPMRMLVPMRMDTCITSSLFSSATPISSGLSPNVESISNSLPKTSR